MTTVFIIDDIVAKPGQGRALLEAYRQDYAPGAKARGMALERIEFRRVDFTHFHR